MLQPSDLVKQSLPFSYFFVEAASNDNQFHNVELYSDISAGTQPGRPIAFFVPGPNSSCFIHSTEWLSGDRTNKVSWDTVSDDNVIFHEVRLLNSFRDQSTWLSWNRKKIEERAANLAPDDAWA